jgi:hypothetical protein
VHVTADRDHTAQDERPLFESASNRPRSAARALSFADVAGLVTLASLCVGFYPMLLFRSFTGSLVALLLLAPFGLLLLLRTVRDGERAAVAALTIVLWIVVAALFTGAPLLAVKGTVGRESSGLIVILVLCAWAYARGMSPAAREIAPYLAIGLLAVNGLAGVAQVVFDVNDGPLPLQLGRAVGFASSSVYFGALMAAGAVLAASLNRLPVWVRIALIAWFGAASNLSGTRVATIAGAIILVVHAIAVGRGSAVWERVARPVAFVAGTFVASVVGPWFSDVHNATTRGTTGGGERLQAWRYGASAVLDRPIGGWGFGRFRAATQARFSPEFVHNSAFDDVRQAWFDAHNVIVNTAVSIGIVGLVIVLWFVWESRHVSAPVAWFAATMALTWMAQPAGLAPLALVAILWGAGAQPERELDDPETIRPTWAPSRQAQLALFGVGGLVAAFLFTADLRLKHAIDTGDPELIEDAAAWYPDDAVVADIVAQAWFFGRPNDPEFGPRVIDWSHRAVDAEPDRPYHWSRLALRQGFYGDYEEALKSIDRALELEPWHLQSWYVLRALGDRFGDEETVSRATSALCDLSESLPECSAAATAAQEPPAG